jgi:hypothetical protein
MSSKPCKVRPLIYDSNDKSSLHVAVKIGKDLAPSSGVLTPQHFMRGMLCSFPYRIIQCIGLGLFHPQPRPEQWPQVGGGILFWRLYPRTRKTVVRLDRLMEQALAVSCAAASVFMARRDSITKIVYRFVLTKPDHAHAGWLEFTGPAVERFLDCQRQTHKEVP